MLHRTEPSVPLAWDVEQLRFTGFPITPSPAGHQRWWFDLMGEEPEEDTTRLREGVQMQKGPFHGGTLVIGMDPTRIDLAVTARAAGSEPTLDFDVLGKASEVIPAFAAVCERWLALQDVPSLHRIAFGGVAVLPVPTRPDGYRILQSLLPAVQLDPDGSTDFMYQINRPKPRSAENAEYTINRLAKWSVARVQLFQMQGGAIQLSTPEGQHGVRVDLDINTVPINNPPIPGTHLQPLARALRDELDTIIQRGDVR